MTTTATRAPQTSAPTIDEALLEDIREHASALDRGEEQARRSFPKLGERGLLDLGAPHNSGGNLPAQVDVIRAVARECMSTAFALWATRMTIEYLRAAGTDTASRWADELATGNRLGVTGMASAMKDVAGCGSVDLSATEVDGGYTISGSLRWASNLYDDSLMVSAARAGDGSKFVFALPLEREGVSLGKPFGLLGLGSTASSFVTLDEVFVSNDEVLSRNFETFLRGIRPTFLTLQTAMCVGLASKSLEEAREGLVGVNSVFAAEVDTTGGRHALIETTTRRLAASVGTEEAPRPKELLSMRLAAAEVATAAAGLEIRTAGGKGYASATPASRRFREATFIPVQSPSEGQLRWELSQAN